jgi:hypothetical protein
MAELLGNRAEDRSQLVGLLGKEGTSSRVLCDPLQSIVAFAEEPAAAVGQLLAGDLCRCPQRDRVYRDTLTPRKVEHVLGADQARGICAVRQQHDCLTPDGLWTAHSSGELLQRDVQRVVHGRGPSGDDLAQRGLDCADIRCQRLTYPHGIAELDDARAVPGPERLCQRDGRIARQRHLAVHARARVQENRQVERYVRGREERYRLTYTVLQHDEIVGAQPEHMLFSPVGDRHAERDEIDAGLEGCFVRGGRFDGAARANRGGSNQ